MRVNKKVVPFPYWKRDKKKSLSVVLANFQSAKKIEE